MKTLIKNARIYDGSGGDAFAGSVLIEDEKIAAVIPDAPDAEMPAADKEIDLNGLSLSQTAEAAMRAASMTASSKANINPDLTAAKLR